MGIQGLLPLLKSIMVPIHIKDLEGCCVAVDTYSWLHKGALSCSKDLCKGQPASRHIDYCMHRVNLLRHNGIKPIMVFDGGFLPMKSEQENKRARARKENLSRAMEHESNGNSAAAYECYQKAVDISPSVAYGLIQVLKQENVYYVVAPYEADAQMTFLAISKQVDAVITEDSDLIAFGCPRIIYKMDKFGQGVEFQYSMLQQNKELNFTGFTKQMLLEMCILSGCDYLQSLPGMGPKRAHALMKKFKSYDKVIKHLKYSTVSVPPSYEESFKKAILTFRHQRVYDPTTEDIIHLSDPSSNIDDDSDFLGPSLPQHIAKGIARGDLDPFTKMPFQGENVSDVLVIDETSQLKIFKPEGERRKLDLPAQKNLLTSYFCFASLEAKRKFRAPRVTPNHPNPMKETSSPVELEPVPEEAAACKISGSPAALLDLENLGIIPPAKYSVNNGVAANSREYLASPANGLNNKEDIMGDTRSSQHALLQQSSHSIHKPCIALHKDRECRSATDAGEGKTGTENIKVILRSSYFQHKSVKTNDLENKNEMLLVRDDVAMDTCKLASDAGEGKMRIQNRNVPVKSSYFPHKPVKENGLESKNEMLLVRDDVAMNTCKSASYAGEGKMRRQNRGAIVRSSYFQHKPVKENDHDKENGMLLVKDSITDNTCENTTPETASFSDNYFKGTTMKRKVALVDSVQMENMNYKCMRTNVSLPIQSNYTSNLKDKVVETKAEEGKFGCDISHLVHYSDIAEKSIENFVSVISSFKCSSSGSRASGLRAPLKDVQNASTSRSNIGMDFSKFAYVPTNRKAPSAPRRV